MAQETKSDRVEKLLRETEGYLQKLGVKLQKQKELARLENDHSENNSVFEVAKQPDAKDNTQVSSKSLSSIFVIKIKWISWLLILLLRFDEFFGLHCAALS